MKVIGMGEKKTPVAFRAACDKFIYIEVIRAAAQSRQKAAQPAKQASKAAESKGESKAEGKSKSKSTKKSKTAQPEKQETPAAVPAEAEKAESLAARKEQGVPEEIVKLIVDSVSDITDEDGYAFMGELGNLLLKKQPDFDPRNFGYTKLTQLIRAIGRFEIDARVIDATKTRHIYLRDKEA